ncbi:histidine--tRNA ligase [Salaquimonas pukyongi]|uniref:histidine--tRNA ligase n=1 Tax=Salaquimonas pukyongi TaxID=2712698 RepID=UPI00096BC3B0|nr:histidine--tRNA ligase [Salaquimonas pukyongi]
MSEKKKKPQKLKARLPRGFVDRSPADIRATDEMVAKIREVFERYGFDPVETPMFEFTDCLGKFLPDSDRPNEGVFSVQDDDEQWMSLRYDLTAPLARHVAENINEIQLPYRTYRNGWVFRNEKPGPGRFRQFMQFDADSVGAPGVQADAEMCMMMADVMEALGIARGDYVIRVNNRKVLDGVMEAIGLGGEENAERRLGVMRSIDKLDKFGIEGVKLLLGPGRWDGGKEGEGDFTPGVGLRSNDIDWLLSFLASSIDFAVLDDGKRCGYIYEGFDTDRFEGDAENTFERGSVDLANIKALVAAAGYSSDRIKIDPSVVRGLEYYTGPVFEAELTFPVKNEKGQEVVFGSVGGGGRYDGLVKRFTGQDVPATGFSIGVSRLMTALKNLGKLGQDDEVAPVLVTVMDKDTGALGNYQKMVQDLRQAGIRAEMYQGNPNKFGKQLQYADRREMPIAIIQGSDERAQGKVQIKDMIEGRKQAAAIESNEEWRETRPGQFEIDEADLLAEVTRLLAEQKAEWEAG